MKLTKNPDADKCKHSGYGIRFDALSKFSLSNGEWSKNVVIFGVDNSYSMDADNRGKDILVLGEDTADGLDDSAIPAEAKCFLIITKSKSLFISELQWK